MPSRRPTAAPRPTRRPPPRQVRIIGGSLRRTPLPVPDEPGLRPTPDRVRETLFNWLTHLWAGRFEGRRVLDLFAGTGALGLEAASRGVAHVDLVEQNRRVAGRLRELCQRLAPEHTQVHAMDATTFLEQRPAHYDLILLDPPFATDWLDRLLPALQQHLSTDGLLYLESAATPSIQGWATLRHGKAAAVHYYLLTPEG